MDMYIRIPSGIILMRGQLVHRLSHNPYIIENGNKVFLTDAEKKLAREMRRVFAGLIDGEEQK